MNRDSADGRLTPFFISARYQEGDTKCHVCGGELPAVLTFETGGTRLHPTNLTFEKTSARLHPSTVRSASAIAPQSRPTLARAASIVVHEVTTTLDGSCAVWGWPGPESDACVCVGAASRAQKLRLRGMDGVVEWKTAAKGHLWENGGLHVAHGRGTAAQRLQQVMD